MHRQALALRLGAEDSAALRFLIESLNDDGYLEDLLDELARGLAGEDDPEQLEQLVHHFTVALSLQSLVGVGARGLAECLSLQLQALQRNTDLSDEFDPDVIKVALAICRQPMDLLARRDIKHLMPLCGASDAAVRAAITLISRLEPKPGRRFVDVERNVVVPDVLVVKAGSGASVKFTVRLNPRGDAVPAGARHLRQRAQGPQGWRQR